MFQPGDYNQLKRQVRSLQNLANRSTTILASGADSVQLQDGIGLAVPSDGSILAVITGGTNPYSWKTVQPDDEGSWILTDPVSIGTVTMGTPTEPGANAAWERNSNPHVIPGTIVSLYPGQWDNDDVGQEYWFDSPELTIWAKITSDGAPETTLSAGITSTATTAFLNGALGNSRANIRVLIDAEIMQAQTMATGSSLSNLLRGQDGTVATNHLQNTTVRLAGQYSWQSVIPPTTGNDQWTVDASGLSGGFIQEPARERNFNCQVPDDTYVILRRRWRRGTGAGTLSNAMTADDTTIAVSGAGFPSMGDGYMLLVDGEFMWYNVNLAQVTRGQFASYPTAHEIGTPVYEAIAEWIFDYDARPVQGIGAYVETSVGQSIEWTIATVDLDNGLSNGYAYDRYGFFQQSADLFQVPVGYAGNYCVMGSVIGEVGVSGTLTHAEISDNGDITFSSLYGTFPGASFDTGTMTLNGTLTFSGPAVGIGITAVDVYVDVESVPDSTIYLELYQWIAKTSTAILVDEGYYGIPALISDVVDGDSGADPGISYPFSLKVFAAPIWADEGDRFYMRISSSPPPSINGTITASVTRSLFQLHRTGIGSPSETQLPITNP